MFEKNVIVFLELFFFLFMYYLYSWINQVHALEFYGERRVEEDSKRGWGVGYSDLYLYEEYTFDRNFPLSHQKLFKTPNLRVNVTFY